MQTLMKFTQEEKDRLLAADRTSLAIGNNWNLRTQFVWPDEWQTNLCDLIALPEGITDIDELISSFLADKQEWNQHFAGFINDFGLAALIASKDAVVPENGWVSGEWVSFVGEDTDYVHIREVVINFVERLISIVVKR
ncbi:hypothetical protein IQ277_28040 [Nostocales cyanobacterium LEGE 12452]|nr:hypothetical protein [Nostocales cyanobacterium LEGE 12452]